jgi:hypothetical protein
MDWKTEWRSLALGVVVFLACFWLAVSSAVFDSALVFVHPGVDLIDGISSP